MLTRNEARNLAWNWVMQNGLTDCILRDRGRFNRAKLRTFEVGYFTDQKQKDFWLVVELRVLDDGQVVIGRDRR